jgi:hypothetical protein
MPSIMARKSGAAGIPDGLCHLLRAIHSRALGSHPFLGFPSGRVGRDSAWEWEWVFRTGPLVRANARKQTKRSFSVCAEMCDFVGTVFESYPLPHVNPGKRGVFVISIPPARARIRRRIRLSRTRSRPAASRVMPWVSAADHGVAKAGQALGCRALSGPALPVRKKTSTSERQARSRVRLPELASACRSSARCASRLGRACR